MPCCGGKRGPSPWTRGDHRAPEPATAPSSRSLTPLPVLFEYVGPTALVAQGRVTRGRYAFPHPGAQVPVDARDAPSLAGVPHLRRLPAR